MKVVKRDPDTPAPKKEGRIPPRLKRAGLPAADFCECPDKERRDLRKQPRLFGRRRADSNRWMELLQSSALPLGDVAWLNPPDQEGERETGIEPATFSLARRCSTTEPLPHCVCTIKISYSGGIVNRFLADIHSELASCGGKPKEREGFWGHPRPRQEGFAPCTP
jgi:hypothetical protein